MRHPLYCLAHHACNAYNITNANHFSTSHKPLKLAYHLPYPRWHITNLTHAGTSLSLARHPHHPRKHAVHAIHSSTPPTQSCHPCHQHQPTSTKARNSSHLRYREQHAISQTLQKLNNAKGSQFLPLKAGIFPYQIPLHVHLPNIFSTQQFSTKYFQAEKISFIHEREASLRLTGIFKFFPPLNVVQLKSLEKVSQLVHHHSHKSGVVLIQPLDNRPQTTCLSCWSLYLKRIKADHVLSSFKIYTNT